MKDILKDVPVFSEDLPPDYVKFSVEAFFPLF